MTQPAGSGAQDANPSSPPAAARLALVVAIGIGIALRAIQYAAGRSLWLDEAVLANALRERSFLGVLEPGPWHAVPPGFMLLSKAALELLGPGELALRLLPFVGGVSALLLVAVAARRALSPVGAAAAVTIFALASYPIYYASELKQYSTDAALAAALLCWALALRGGPLTRPRAAALALGGLAATLVSFTAVFMLGGVGLAFGVAALRERRWRDVRTLAGIALFWVIGIGGPGIFLLSRIAGEGAYVNDFWRDGFPPLPPRSLHEALWLPRMLVKVFREPMGVLEYRETWVNFVQIGAGALAAALGAAALWRRDRALAGMLLLPVLLAVGAAAVRAYPFGGGPATSGRVLLFLSPLAALLMGEGIAWLSRRARATRALAAALLLGAVAPAVAENLRRVPYGRSEIEPMLAFVEDHLQAGDLLYVHYDIHPSFRFYRGQYDLRGAEVRRGVCSRIRPVRYLEALNRLRGRGRVWVLIGGGTGSYGLLESRLMLDFLDHFGTRLDDRVATGASVFLYDLREKSPPAGPYNVRLPTFPEGTVDDCPFFENA